MQTKPPQMQTKPPPFTNNADQTSTTESAFIFKHIQAFG